MHSRWETTYRSRRLPYISRWDGAQQLAEIVRLLARDAAHDRRGALPAHKTGYVDITEDEHSSLRRKIPPTCFAAGADRGVLGTPTGQGRAPRFGFNLGVAFQLWPIADHLGRSSLGSRLRDLLECKVTLRYLPAQRAEEGGSPDPRVVTIGVTKEQCATSSASSTSSARPPRRTESHVRDARQGSLDISSRPAASAKALFALADTCSRATDSCSRRRPSQAPRSHDHKTQKESL